MRGRFCRDRPGGRSPWCRANVRTPRGFEPGGPPNVVCPADQEFPEKSRRNAHVTAESVSACTDCGTDCTPRDQHRGRPGHRTRPGPVARDDHRAWLFPAHAVVHRSCAARPPDRLLPQAEFHEFHEFRPSPRPPAARAARTGGHNQPAPPAVAAPAGGGDTRRGGRSRAALQLAATASTGGDQEFRGARSSVRAGAPRGRPEHRGGAFRARRGRGHGAVRRDGRGSWSGVDRTRRRTPHHL